VHAGFEPISEETEVRERLRRKLEQLRTRRVYPYVNFRLLESGHKSGHAIPVRNSGRVAVNFEGVHSLDAWSSEEQAGQS
jgi:hypothetical protein